MDDLPYNKMYAVRHGVTGKIWQPAKGMWLWKSPDQLVKTWNQLKKVKLVNSDISQHDIITINLIESDNRI